MESNPIRGDDSIMNNTQKSWLFLLSFIILTPLGVFTKLYFLTFLGVFSIIPFIYIVRLNSDEMDKFRNDNFAKVLAENNFKPDKKTFSHNQLSGMAISEERKQIAFLSRNTLYDEFIIKLFNFEDIIETKVITQSDTLTSTSIGSIATRGIIGGIVSGGLGAIIGGVTAKQNSTQKIKELTLEFVVDDLLNPRYTLTFYKSELPLKQSSPIIEKTETWYRIFSVIINRNSNEARSV